MAQQISISAQQAECEATLSKAFQSGHINFLLGSGASLPAIKTAGGIEAKLDVLLDSDKEAFESEKRQFLSEIQEVTNALITGKKSNRNSTTLNEYRTFLQIVLSCCRFRGRLVKLIPPCVRTRQG